MASPAGVVTVPSPYSVAETLDRLQTSLAEHGTKVFARIDQAAEARAVGLSMPEIQLLIFGNPKGGTPIMLAEPLAALDLPLKALAWQDHEGRVFVSYNESAYLGDRFNLSAELVKPISGLGNLIEQVLR
jgi:uncharacterized protein (DUF302 family)